MTKPQSQNSERKEEAIAQIKKRNLEIQEMLACADEWGIFVGDSDTYNGILEDVSTSNQKLDKDINEALKYSTLAHHKFSEKINSSRRWDRFIFSFGGPILLYLLLMLTSTLLAWVFFQDIILSSTLLWIPSWAFLWGLVGGILQGFWFLWQHINRYSLRKYWMTWYLLLPLMGSILGALTYLIFYSGFIAATGEAQIKSEFFVMLLSALAGFSTKWAIEMLESVTAMIKIGK